MWELHRPFAKFIFTLITAIAANRKLLQRLKITSFHSKEKLEIIFFFEMAY